MTINEILILIPAVTAATVSIINALKAKERATKLDLNTEMTAQTQATVSKVQSLVNGQSEALRVALETAQARVTALEAELAHLRATWRPAGHLPPAES